MNPKHGHSNVDTVAIFRLRSDNCRLRRIMLYTQQGGAPCRLQIA